MHHHKKYTPSLSVLSFRQRTEPVKAYLDISMNERGDNRLAYILSSGSKDDGALNQLLIQGLTPLMLRKHAMPELERAIQEQRFSQNIAKITRGIVSFAKHEQRFTHPFSDAGISLIYKALYNWVDSLTKQSFHSLIKSSLKQCDSKKLWGSYWNKANTLEIERCLQGNCNSKALALIFSKDVEFSALNRQLFSKIVETIKKEMNSGQYPQMQEELQYRLISYLNLEEHKDFYLAQLGTHRDTIAALTSDSDKTQSLTATLSH